MVPETAEERSDCLRGQRRLEEARVQQIGPNSADQAGEVDELRWTRPCRQVMDVDADRPKRRHQALMLVQDGEVHVEPGLHEQWVDRGERSLRSGG